MPATDYYAHVGCPTADGKFLARDMAFDVLKAWNGLKGYVRQQLNSHCCPQKGPLCFVVFPDV